MNSSNAFSSLLLLLFIALKLTHVITWSWLWVLSPMWISAAIAVLAILIMAAYYPWFETESAKTGRILRAYARRCK